MTAPKFTESDMLLMLRARLCGSAEGKNGEQVAFVTHVRNQTGFAAGKQERTADAISLGLWPSRGLLLEGYEVKCSRSDWKRELDRPEKADDFFRYCDRWWLVVSDASFVHEGELPVTWGLLAAKGGKLHVVKEAPKHEPEPMSRSILCGLLRSAVRVGDATPEEIQAAERRAREYAERMWKQKFEHAEAAYEQARDALNAFQRTSGISLSLNGHSYYGSHDPAEVGRALKLVLDGETQLERAENRLRNIAESAERLAEEARASLPSQEAAA